MVKVCDAHVHVGYFNRRGYDEPYYYSPRRICMVMKKCGVEEFIYSSTSMQAHGIVFADVHREMREVKKLFGTGAHPFLWVTGAYLQQDSTLSALNGDFYEGIKLHGLETDWLNSFPEELELVLLKAEALHLPVMVHTCGLESSRPINWLPYARRHESINFNFAHGSPIKESIICLRETRNVFVDTSCMIDRDVATFFGSHYRDRILLGTDFPVTPAKAGDSHLTMAYRKLVMAYTETDIKDSKTAFHRFLSGERG